MIIMKNSNFWLKIFNNLKMLNNVKMLKFLWKMKNIKKYIC